MIAEVLLPIAFVCSLAMCIFKRPAGFRRANFTKRLENVVQKEPKTPMTFPKGVLCAEQLKYYKSDSATSSIVYDMPRRNFNSPAQSRSPPQQLQASPLTIPEAMKRNSILRVQGSGSSPATAKKTSSVSICANGTVTYNMDKDVGAITEEEWSGAAPSKMVESPGEKRKVSPADSGMYSTSSCSGEALLSPSNQPSLTVTAPPTAEEEEEEEGEEDSISRDHVLDITVEERGEDNGAEDNGGND